MFNVGRSMFNVRKMSAPLRRKGLPPNPTRDDILSMEAIMADLN
jgi:hypothetical protein